MEGIDLIKHKELIEALDRIHRLRTPLPGASIEQIMYDAGRRALIDNLVLKLKDQEENAYKN